MTATLADLDQLTTGLPEAAHAALTASQRLLSALGRSERGHAEAPQSLGLVGCVELRPAGEGASPVALSRHQRPDAGRGEKEQDMSDEGTPIADELEAEAAPEEEATEEAAEESSEPTADAAE